MTVCDVQDCSVEVKSLILTQLVCNQWLWLSTINKLQKFGWCFRPKSSTVFIYTQAVHDPVVLVSHIKCIWKWIMLQECFIFKIFVNISFQHLPIFEMRSINYTKILRLPPKQKLQGFNILKWTIWDTSNFSNVKGYNYY